MRIIFPPVRHAKATLTAGLVMLTAPLVTIACIPPRASSVRCAASTVLDRPAASRAEWSTTSAAQRIEGRVLEAGHDLPLGNASVVLSPPGRAARTDAKGTFRFDDVPPGSYRVLTEATAYDSRVDSVRIVAGHGMKGDVQLSLRRSPSAACQKRLPTPL